MSVWQGLAVVGAVVILILAVVAGVLQYKVHRLNRARKAQQQELEAASEAQRERINKSIQVIAHSVGSNDITLTEASIRISVLLDSLGVEDPVREEFSAFYELKTATEHIPILQAWKDLSTKQKFKYDRDRTTQEQFHEKAVVEAAKRIRGRQF
ncbi:DUF2489 domain-containing protein [Marinimicrobium agarilyticum]|uniref:DUF2489 domain-containing protein n=1 Tax=Marinimicrobium agarilyticum TaxID=306546 RepID=UPI000423E686|nr:DUF2489 domain-containing protein [Marinimicrobium agarilyticum]